MPERLSVMGYCGYPGGRFLTPPLSTVDLHYDAIGRKVVEVLARADRWFGRKNVAVPEIIMPHDVVMRESTMVKRVEPLILSAKQEEGGKSRCARRTERKELIFYLLPVIWFLHQILGENIYGGNISLISEKVLIS